MSSFVEQCVTSYLELASRDRGSLRDVPTPLLDASSAWKPPEGEPTGALAHVAVKIILKIVYVARMARPDILRATCMLGRNASRWRKEFDRRLHRLVSYMNCIKDWVQHSYVGDNFSDIRLGLFTDADFAGDKTDSKSTSGVFIAAGGPHTYAPIVSISKKQGCVSTSTCESEVVAMNLGLKEAMSISDLRQALEPVFSGSGGLPLAPYRFITFVRTGRPLTFSPKLS